MSAAVLSESLDAPMMDYDAAGPDDSWYTAEATMDSVDDGAPGVEVDMEPDTLAEYDMNMSGDELAAYAAGSPLDVEVYDAADVVELDAVFADPAAIAVAPAHPFAGFSPVVTPALAFQSDTAPVPTFALPTPVAELAQPAFPTPFDLGDATSGSTLPADPVPESGFSVMQGLAEHHIEPHSTATPLAFASHDGVAPETVAVDVAQAMAPANPVDDAPATIAPPDAGADPHEDAAAPPTQEAHIEPVAHESSGGSAFAEDQTEVQHLDGSAEHIESGAEPANAEGDDGGYEAEGVADEGAYPEDPEAIGLILPAPGVVEETSVAELDAEESTPPAPPVLLALSTSSEPDWCLFNPVVPNGEEAGAEVESPDVRLLLQDRAHLCFAPMVHVFQALRAEPAIAALPNAATGDMMLDAYDIDLTISEDNVHAREISLWDLTDLHAGYQLPGPLRVRVYFTASRFITRYLELRDHMARIAVEEAQQVEVDTQQRDAGTDEDDQADVEVLEQQEGELANDPTAEAEVPDLEADEGGAENEADDDADADVNADADADADADAEADDADEDSVTAAAALAVPGDEDEEQYHQVGGAEAATLEDEDDYADVLAPPNDGGTADHSELDAADVHTNADGETDEPGGDTLPTEYEDYAGYVEDDVERAEDELDDSSEVAGLGEVESGVGITGDEKDEQAVWEAAADTIIPTFTPKEMARAAASRTTDKSEHGGSGAHTEAAASADQHDDGPSDHADAYDDETSRAGADGAEAAEDCGDDGTTLAQEEELHSYDDVFDEETGAAKPASRSSAPTVSTNSSGKRGFEEVSGDEDDVEDPRASPGSKRVRAQ